MTDRRRLASNGRVAHVSLRGKVQAERFAEGELKQVSIAQASLFSERGGPRERQLILGEGFTVLEDDGDMAFGFADRDGYCGYVTSVYLRPFREKTHRVTTTRTYLKDTPGLKTMGRTIQLSFGALLTVIGEEDGWSEIETNVTNPHGERYRQFVPSVHVSPVNTGFDDPVGVAELFLGTPYLWGGNSAFGIDCSGLVQAGCLACGIPCPGDSDMQEAELGEVLPESAPLKRGDLLFWKGHVAWVVDPETILHANAHHMAVAYEGLESAIARIERQGDGPVTARKRLEELA